MEDRRLATIMFTDIVGYTALMGADEDKAFKILQNNRDMHNELIPRFNGRIIKEIGDGMLISFNLTSDAVNCAIELQIAGFERDIPLKIGIHQGEVVFGGNDVLGDGVNVAARLQDTCEAGCINISGRVNSDVKNRPDISTIFLGEKQFKNVDEKIKVYQVLTDIQHENIRPEIKSTRRNLYILGTISILIIVTFFIWNYLIADRPTLSDQEKSIAVMPFDNASNDIENQYFVDGMMEDIRNNLSNIGDLRIISKTSTQKYRGTSLSSSEIGSELSVNYLVEGTVQKIGNQLKIHAQLIDVKNDDHLWQETYLRDISDIKEVFRTQTEIAESIADELRVVITPAEKALIARIPTESSEAYDVYLRAVFTWSGGTDKDVKEAVELLEKAILIDPEFADAYALLGFLKSQFWWFGRSNLDTPEEAFTVGMTYYNKALEIDPNNIFALENSASSLILYRWDFEEAEKKIQILNQLDPNRDQWGHLIPFGRFEKALEISESIYKSHPYSESALYSKMMTYYFNDRADDALQALELARMGNFRNIHLDMDIARVYLYMEMYNETIDFVDQFFQNYNEFSDTPRPLAYLAIAYSHTGKIKEASEILERIKKIREQNIVGSPSFYITMIYAQMGEIDLAFNWLDKSFEDHDVEMYWLKVDPLFEPLHDDPHWKEMLDMVGFPD